MLSDEWLPRYRLLENFTAKWNGNGNAYDRGDYNSSFALRAVELKTKVLISCAVTTQLICAFVFTCAKMQAGLNLSTSDLPNATQLFINHLLTFKSLKYSL